MRLLLDTHIMIWWAIGDEQLSPKARSLIADSDNDCFVSVASLWEVAIKSSLGRGLPPGLTAERYAGLVEGADFRLKTVRPQHAIAVEALDPIHGDPFDRLMVAQAKVEGLTLVTHDQKLAAYGECVLLV